MKKLFSGLVVMALVLFVTACGGGSDKAEMKDGKYQAAGNVTETGWTYYMTFDVKDGKIADVDYNGVNLRDGIKETKKVESEAG
ncbi:MAG: hypothetical protein RR425_00800, partial [Erysipelotrichales bacterium]